MPTIEYTNGILGEHLFYSEPNENHKISYLNWDRNLILYGIDIETRYKNLNFDFSLTSSFPNQTSGTMEDSDWLNRKDYSIKTRYSIGDNEIDKNYELGTSIYYKFDITKNLKIAPVIQAQFFYDSFYRYNANAWYNYNLGWWYEDDAIHYPRLNPETGKIQQLAGIAFEQKTFYVWNGIDFDFTLNKRFSFSFSFLLSPFIYFSAIDTHYLNKARTESKHIKYENSALFSCLKLDFTSSIIISKYFDLLISFSDFFTFETYHAKTYSDTFQNVKQDDYYELGQDSGFSTNSISVKIGFRIKVL